MFSVVITEDEIIMSGRLDAMQAESAKTDFQKIDRTMRVNCSALDYISSAGLGVLLMTEKRLRGSGHRLILQNLKPHLREIFGYAGLDAVFQID